MHMGIASENGWSGTHAHASSDAHMQAVLALTSQETQVTVN